MRCYFSDRLVPPLFCTLWRNNESATHASAGVVPVEKVQKDQLLLLSAHWVSAIVVTLLIHKSFQHHVRANSAAEQLWIPQTHSHYSFSSFLSSSSPHLRPISLFQLRNMINVHLATGGFSNCQHTGPVSALCTHIKHTHTHTDINMCQYVCEKRWTQKKRYAKKDIWEAHTKTCYTHPHTPHAHTGEGVRLGQVLAISQHINHPPLNNLSVVLTVWDCEDAAVLLPDNGTVAVAASF